MIKNTEEEKPPECPVCLENFKRDQLFFRWCGHAFCESCFKQTMNEACPLCRRPETIPFSTEQETYTKHGGIQVHYVFPNAGPPQPKRWNSLSTETRCKSKLFGHQCLHVVQIPSEFCAECIYPSESHGKFAPHKCLCVNCFNVPGDPVNSLELYTEEYPYRRRCTEEFGFGHQCLRLVGENERCHRGRCVFPYASHYRDGELIKIGCGCKYCASAI